MKARWLAFRDGRYIQMRKLTPRNWVYLLLHVVLFMAGVLLVQTDGVLWSGVGSSLIAAAVAGWVLFVWVMVSQTQAERIEMVVELGLVAAFPGRSSKIKHVYDSELAGAKQSIDVMGFGLRQLREDYGSEFGTWTSKAVVRILLLAPDAPTQRASYANQRDLEEGNSTGSIVADVSAFLSQTEPLRKASPERFQVRLYKAIPSVNVFRVDDVLFWGPYLVKRQSRNTPTFVVKRGGSLFDAFQSQFDQIWTDDSLSHDPP
jgi:hypothetical protein